MTSLFALVAPAVLGPALILPICAVLAIVAIGWLAYNHVASQPAPAVAAVASSAGNAGLLGGMLGNVDRLLHLHTGGEVPQRLVSGLRALGRIAIEYDQRQDHRELNALLTHVAPGLAPFLPLIDKGVEVAEKKVQGQDVKLPQELLDLWKAFLAEKNAVKPQA